jgi:hypothetical protein
MVDVSPRRKLVTVPDIGHAPTLVEPVVLAALDRLLGGLRGLSPRKPFLRWLDHVGRPRRRGRRRHLVAVGGATSVGLGVPAAYGSAKVAVLAPSPGTVTGCVIAALSAPVTASPKVTTAPAMHPPGPMLTS